MTRTGSHSNEIIQMKGEIRSRDPNALRHLPDGCLLFQAISLQNRSNRRKFGLIGHADRAFPSRRDILERGSCSDSLVSQFRVIDMPADTTLHLLHCYVPKKYQLRRI
jgi:hypothetical protein